MVYNSEEAVKEKSLYLIEPLTNGLLTVTEVLDGPVIVWFQFFKPKLYFTSSWAKAPIEANIKLNANIFFMILIP